VIHVQEVLGEAAKRHIAEMRDRPPAFQRSICAPGCPLCGGLGYLRESRAIGDPQYGKLELCPNVDRLGLPGAARYGVTHDELASLSWDSVTDQGQALAAAEVVRATLERGYGWVFLWGGYGLAKTLILKVAVTQWLKAGGEAAYTRMASVIDNLRAAFDADDPSEESERRLAWWTSVPVLAVDEFDRVRSTEYADERRFLLMDRRYEAAGREKTVTLMASNTDPRQLPGYLADRVLDGRFKVVQLTGQSFRPGMG
jgi:DNA replication protein DnaC